jgi:hypothetical protein
MELRLTFFGLSVFAGCMGTLAFGPTPAMEAGGPCDAVHAAYNKMFSASPKMVEKNSGAVDVTKAMGAITGSGSYRETCKFLRDESLDGERAAVYSEGFKSKAGNTDGMVWISKRTGATLRQEVDVDLGSKGKGHQSIRFEYAKK